MVIASEATISANLLKLVASFIFFSSASVFPLVSS